MWRATPGRTASGAGCRTSSVNATRSCARTSPKRIRRLRQVQSFLAILSTSLTLVIIIGGPLAWLYLQERVKNVAREQTDRAIADYKHEHDRTLAALNADHQRRLQEFNLFTQKQHQVYAALYKRIRIAADSYDTMIGLTMGPDFASWTIEGVRGMLARYKVPEGDAAAAIAAYQQGENEKAAKLMDDTYFRIQRRRADQAFGRAKNFEALYELYLSDPVRQQLDAVRSSMAEVSVVLMREDDERDRSEYKKEQEMLLQVRRLYHVMRDEIRSGRNGGGAASLPSAEGP